MNEKSNKTAVEWFFKWFNDNPEATHKEYAEAFEQAKEMEKQQIIDAHGNKQKMNAGISTYKYTLTGEQYYNETYGK